ncbi:MAG: flippase-like domain-containing protein [Methanolinea sp.]
MDQDWKKKLVFIIQICVGIILIFAILKFISATEFLRILGSLDIRFFLLALFCYFLNNVLMVFRLKRLLAHQGQKIRIKFVFWAHMAGMILSDFTPLRSGYLYTAQALRKRGIPLDAGTATITSTYIYDLLFKISVALIGISYLYASLLSPQISSILILTILLIAIILGTYFLLLYLPNSFKVLVSGWKTGEKILGFGIQARRIQQFFPMILGISFLGWLLRGLQWFFIGLSLHLVFHSPLDAFFLSPLLTLFSLVPLSPAGIGIQEAAIITFFALIGIPVALSASFAFLVRGSEILVDAIGTREFFFKLKEQSFLVDHYQATPGDIDDRAFHSNLLVQRYFQQRKTREISDSFETGRDGLLIDIGCGSGVQVAELQKQRQGMALGIDLNREALRYANGMRIPRASFIQADVHYLPIRDTCINQVVSAEIIEHLPRPHEMLSEIRRILVPGGEVVITTPNDHSIWGLYEVLWDLFGRGRNYGETHLMFFSPAELCSFFKDFSSCSTKTIFFLSPLFALTQNRSLLKLGIRLDSFFEARGWGVSIILYAKK